MRIHCGMPKEVQSRTAMPLVIMACLTPSAIADPNQHEVGGRGDERDSQPTELPVKVLLGLGDGRPGCDEVAFIVQDGEASALRQRVDAPGRLELTCRANHGGVGKQVA